MAYIDVDKFAEKICSFQAIDEDCANKMIWLLRTFPTADVAKVVRCKDCKYLTKEYIGDTIVFVCKSAKGMVNPAPDFYCSYGERKEDNHSLDTVPWSKFVADAWIGAFSGGLTGMRTTLYDNDLKKKYTEEGK